MMAQWIQSAFCEHEQWRSLPVSISSCFNLSEPSLVSSIDCPDQMNIATYGENKVKINVSLLTLIHTDKEACCLDNNSIFVSPFTIFTKLGKKPLELFLVATENTDPLLELLGALHTSGLRHPGWDQASLDAQSRKYFGV